MRYLYILIIAISIQSCTSDYYEEWTLRSYREDNREMPDVGRARIEFDAKAYSMGDYRNIDVYAFNAMRVTGKHGVALVLPEETQHVHDLSIKFPEGGAEIIKRASRYDSAVENGEGVRIIVKPNGTTVKLNNPNRTLTQWPGIMPSELTRVRLIETGKNSIIIFGCDTVANIETDLLASENTIIRPLNSSDTIDIRGIDLYSLIQWDRDEYITRPSPITGI